MNIAIFASGNGTNAINIIDYFKSSVKLLLCNKADAPVLNKTDIDKIIVTRENFYQNDEILDILLEKEIDFIILAGFLWLFPINILKKYQNRVINIHPSLLPKYGGKGMYGMNVHNAVKKAQETETGITIHIIDEEYDKGEILFQTKCQIVENDTPQDIANKVHDLEMKHFPSIIEEYINNVTLQEIPRIKIRPHR